MIGVSILDRENSTLRFHCEDRGDPEDCVVIHVIIFEELNNSQYDIHGLLTYHGYFIVGDSYGETHQGITGVVYHLRRIDDKEVLLSDKYDIN